MTQDRIVVYFSQATQPSSLCVCAKLAFCSDFQLFDTFLKETTETTPEACDIFLGEKTHLLTFCSTEFSRVYKLPGVSLFRFIRSVVEVVSCNNNFWWLCLKVKCFHPPCLGWRRAKNHLQFLPLKGSYSPKTFSKDMTSRGETQTSTLLYNVLLWHSKTLST